METDLSQEATKRVLLGEHGSSCLDHNQLSSRIATEALQHMTARLSGGIIPRNMARCIPSSKPGLDAVDKLLSSALATLGLQYEAQHYRVAPVSSEDQAEGNADGMAGASYSSRTFSMDCCSG
jgi:putative component of membrane protein insertase Oxa1/YidC/SpoIIIJ protein YidD